MIEIDESLVPDPSHVELANPGTASKRCAGPLHKSGVYLTLGSFYGNRARVDGLASRCKDCERYWEATHRDSGRSRKRRWREKKFGKDVEVRKAGYSARLRAFEDTGEYDGPDSDDAAARLRRFERGETYRKI